jgi:hypothetical protein
VRPSGKPRLRRSFALPAPGLASASICAYKRKPERPIRRPSDTDTGTDTDTDRHYFTVPTVPFTLNPEIVKVRVFRMVGFRPGGVVELGGYGREVFGAQGSV